MGVEPRIHGSVLFSLSRMSSASLDLWFPESKGLDPSEYLAGWILC